MNLAVGFFDGVHLGHQRILAQADAALTFSNHPATVFAPARAPRLLMTCADRLAAISVALHDAQSDSIRALDFTPAFAAQPPVAFADWLRVEYPALDTLYCGENWTFGVGGMGNADFLRARGFRVEVVPYADYEGEPISSTRIRAALAAGNLVAANAMLGRPYSLLGRIVSGKGLGRSMGFPTLNVLPKLADSPLTRGVYAVATPFGRGLANWGVAPTMGERAWKSPVLEVHLLGETSICSQDVSDAELRVAFLSFLRPERTFPSIADLQAQIARDAVAAQEARPGQMSKME